MKKEPKTAYLNKDIITPQFTLSKGTPVTIVGKDPFLKTYDVCVKGHETKWINDIEYADVDMER